MKTLTRFEAGKIITGNKHPTGYGMQRDMCELTGLRHFSVHNWFTKKAKSKPVDLLLRVMLALKEEESLDRIMARARAIEIKKTEEK